MNARTGGRRYLRAVPTNRSCPPGPVIPVLCYPDVRAAAAWLCQAFGFTERLRIGDHRIQLHVGSGAVVVAEAPKGSTAAADHSVMVPVDDVHAHHARAMRHGATIAAAPMDHPYGERQYSAVDIGGHRWTFTQSLADVDPAEWGGELVAP